MLQKHLNGIAAAVEVACRKQQGNPLSGMASTLVTAFLAAKLRDPRESKALYAVAEGRGGTELVARMRTRIVTAVAAMLASAPDAHFDDPMMTSTIAFGVLAGPVRTLLEGRAPAEFEACLERQLVLLLTAYLQLHQL